MSHALLGRDLEKAIARASQQYRRLGRRCILVKQETATATRADGSMVYTRKGAPCDFLGAVDGTPWAVEAKSIGGDSFPLEERREDQRRHLQILHDNGFKVWLCIEFTDHQEVFLVGWEAVVEFLRAPWRKSLSLQWCRAHGILLPENSTGGENRKVLFLDGLDHPRGEECRGTIRDEQARSPVISLAAPVELPPRKPTAKASAFRDLLARKPPRDAPEVERLRWANEMSAMQLERDFAEARRKQARTKRRGWAGGGR